MKIKEVIVVEGKNDVNKLVEIFDDVTCITTNGSQTSVDTINMIKKAAETRGVILFLDPDGPGKIIRAKIEKEVKNCKHAFIEQKLAISKNKKKVGIEHATREVIIKAIEDIYEPYDGVDKVSKADIMALGLIGQDGSSELRNNISLKLNIGSPNAKQFLKRINAFNISIEQISDLTEGK